MHWLERSKRGHIRYVRKHNYYPRHYTERLNLVQDSIIKIKKAILTALGELTTETVMVCYH